MKTLTNTFYFQVKDPGSAFTHFIGFLFSIFLMPALLLHRVVVGDSYYHLASVSVFSLSMILLYGASSAYHTFSLEPQKEKILKKIDHMMIFVLIAGSYTPICTHVIWDGSGPWMLALVWGLASIGFFLKFFWVTCPKWFSSCVYIAMGWVCVFAFPEIFRCMNLAGFVWLLAGGILYTVGGVLYALKLEAFNHCHPYFGSHEIFHVFVMAGNFCHFLVMYFYV